MQDLAAVCASQHADEKKTMLTRNNQNKQTQVNVNRMKTDI